LAKGAVAIFILAALVFCGSMLWVLRDLPLDGVSLARERAILLESADGQSLGRVGPLKISNATREEFPKHLVDAVLSIEDRRFYGHWGVDLFGIARALHRNYASGATLQGGSTITQQLVKLRIVGSERSLARKIREAFAAMWLEMRLGKNDILSRYLNSVYMGAGAQGIPAAAELYFNKRPRDLTIQEAAMLAGMIKAPSRFNPLQNLSGAQKRAAVVVQAMVDNGKLTEEAARHALAHPAALNTPAIASESGTWFSDWVAGEARDVTGGLVGTMQVRKPLDPNLQTVAEQAVTDGLRDGADQKVSQAALVAMRPDGAVVAMVGGRNYKESQFNRAVRPGGSPAQHSSCSFTWPPCAVALIRMTPLTPPR
jgi:penicillin-binding protein 1A